MFVARNHVHSKAPAIEDALQVAIANVRSDTAREDWVLCGFQGGDDIRLIGTGVGGVEALKQSIVRWDVCYGLVRCTHTLEQAGYVQTDFIKFVWVYWRPDNIPVMRKMKIGVNEGEMKSLFAPYHAELQACDMQELGEKPLADVLDSVTMRADRTSGTRKLERSPSSPTLLARGRAAWKLARSSLPSMHFAHLAIADEQKKVAASTKVVFEKQEAFAKAVKAVRSDISFADWCLVGYKNETVLRMIGTGKGGLEALLDAAEPFGVNYGLLRVSEKFDLVYHEAYCFITWMPENIPAFVKARVSTHQGAVAAIFRNHVHCQFYFRGAERSDITMDVIRNRVRQIIGKGIGTGGAQAMANCLEQNSIMYGLVRVTETTEGRDDGRGGTGKEKFCCVKWAPEDGVAPQRTPELQGEVSRLFHPYHGDLTAKHANEVTPEAVNSRVTGRLKQ
eukprot:g5315.t1